MDPEIALQLKGLHAGLSQLEKSNMTNTLIISAMMNALIRTDSLDLQALKKDLHLPPIWVVRV